MNTSSRLRCSECFEPDKQTLLCGAVPCTLVEEVGIVNMQQTTLSNMLKVSNFDVLQQFSNKGQIPGEQYPTKGTVPQD